MTILGISAYYHDAAAAIITDGEIIAAAQEERFTRIKNDKNFPLESIRFCLKQAGKSINELDAIVFYDKSFLKFERLIETYYSFAPKGILSFYKAIPEWINEKIFIKKNLRKELGKIEKYDQKKLKLLFTEHHLSHAASAYYPSGFNDAAILTIDGVGEWATTTICHGHGNKIKVLKEMKFPDSVGLLYSAFTYYLGFTVNSDEYKLMGLAPYGDHTADETIHFSKLIKDELVEIFEDGSIAINQHYFKYAYGLTMTNNKKFEKLFGFRKRNRDENFSSQHINLAHAIQQIIEEIVFKLAQHAKQLTGCARLCMAGGVALNCVANGKLQQQGLFQEIFIQPASGDAGGALGAALAGYYVDFNMPLKENDGEDLMKGSLLGPGFSDAEISSMLAANKIAFTEFADINELCHEVAGMLQQGKVVGWFQGAMEFGPRALGNRSILANPSYPDMQRTLNLKIKFREGFRPFAPAVLLEEAGNYFDIYSPSPYMLMVYPLKHTRLKKLPVGYSSMSLYDKLYCLRSDLQAVTHVDNTARVQTVTSTSNPPFYQLLKAYQAITGSGVLVNTSFNVKDEPIVCTPDDALRCFNSCEMDCLVMGRFLVEKK